MSFKDFIFIPLFFLLHPPSFAQNDVLKDSLALQIGHAPSDTARLKVYKKTLQDMKYKRYEGLGKTYIIDALALSRKTDQKEFELFFEFMEAKILLVTKTIQSDEAVAIFHKTLEATQKNKMDEMTYTLSFELGRIYHNHIKDPHLAMDYVLKSIKIFESLTTTSDLQLPYKTMSFMYWLYKKNYTKANYYAEKNLKISLDRGNNHEIGMAYSCLAVINGAQGLHEKEIANYKKCLTYLSKKHHKHEYAMTLHNMANAYSSINDSKNELITFRNSLKLFTEEGETYMPARIKYILGLIHLKNNRKDSAFFYIDQSIRFYTEKKDTDRLSYLHLSIGREYAKKGQLDESLNYYFEALKIAEDSKNYENIAMVSNGISAIHKSQNNIEKAITYQEKALKNYGILKDSSYIAHTKNDISELLLVKHDYQKSLVSSRQALQQFISFQDSCEISNSYIIIGKSFFGLKKLDSAQYYLDQGIPLASNCENPIALASAHSALGQIYTKKNETSYALKSFEKALFFAQQSKNIESIKNTAELLYPFYQESRQYKKAFETLDLYQAGKDSIFNEENTKSLVQKEVKYNFEKKQQQLAFIQQQKDAEQKREIEKQQWITYASILACLSLIGLTLLYYKNAKNKKKANTLLNEQNQKIIKQKIALEELDASKSRLYANISHELRTPLTLISSPINYMLNNQNKTLSPEHISQLKVVERNTGQLKGLVNDILDLSKLESNRINIQEDQIGLRPFLRQVFSNFDSLTKHLGINYEMSTDITDGIAALLDRDKVEKIINNLLSNAIKHTPSKGTVALLAHIEKDFLIIQIKDNGYGIPEKDVPHIFDRFFQGKNAEDTLQGGTGIGLALAKELTHLMDGAITVCSELHVGSTFELRLPYKETDYIQPLPLDPVTIVQDDELLTGIQKTNIDHSQHILIVEDHPDMQRFIVQLLNNKYQTYTANNGKQALEILAKQHIDLIISDVMMPEMDGYELLKELKEHKNYDTIPVVMLTALHDVESKLQALHIGVDDYLSKPFLPEELIARVHNLLERYEVRKLVVQDIKKEENSTTTTSEFSDESLKLTDMQWIEEVKNIIIKELENENFNISTLADEFFLSSRQFQRRINKITGLAPKKFEIEIAMQEARKLLETNAYQSVKAVAMTVGMSNVWRFTQLYQERFGKKPNDYF